MAGKNPAFGEQTDYENLSFCIGFGYLDNIINDHVVFVVAIL